MKMFLACLFPFAAMAQPTCWPAPVGTGTLPVVVENASGRAIAWGCVDQFTARKFAFGGPLVEWSSDWIARGRALAVATDAERAAAWQSMGTINPQVVPLAQTALSQVQVTAPVWQVAKNATYIDRPAYPLVDGARTKTSNGRAAVAAACDCNARAVEGTSVYCGVNGKADQVALCSRVP